MQRPEGYDWDYPGFFSLYCPYGKTNDFFYSGHCGICHIFFLEFWAVGWHVHSLFALLVLLLETFTMIVLRAHYTIDIVSGIAFAHYFFIMAEKYSYLVDYYIFGIPLQKRRALERYSGVGGVVVGERGMEEIVKEWRR